MLLRLLCGVYTNHLRCIQYLSRSIIPIRHDIGHQINVFVVLTSSMWSKPLIRSSHILRPKAYADLDLL